MEHNPFVTVKTFTYPHEVALAKALLEAEEIECFVKDELMAQVNNFYSNAIGGVKLQVRQSDYQQAMAMLIEGGFVKEEKNEPSAVYLFLERFTSKIPVISSLRFELRFAIAFSVLFGLISLIFYLLFRPSQEELLVSNRWCIEKMSVDRKIVYPNTLKFISIRYGNECVEHLSFGSGAIELPGFDTEATYANYELISDEKLEVFVYQDDPYGYKGIYTLSLDDNQLTLSSKRITFYCYKSHGL